MAGKKKVELYTEINNEKEFFNNLDLNADGIICAEIYCLSFGFCTALDRLFTTIKLDWSDGKMILLKVPCDDIEDLRRFRGYSEPVYMFIVRKKVTRVFRGVDSIRFAEIARYELNQYLQEQQGITSDRPLYELYEATPEEMDWINMRSLEQQQEISSVAARRAARQAARKRHRAQLMVPHLTHLNFVLFWPHAIHAHPELYEKWDQNDIVMIAREVLQFTTEQADDVLYAGDAPKNEASMHMLLSGPALAICFRLLGQTDRHFVSLVRRILYEDLISLDETNELAPRKTAFDHYKSFSKTREEIWHQRRIERQRKKEEEIERRARRLSEMKRLALQAREDAIAAKRAEKEQLKLDLLKAGNLTALEKLKQEVDDDDVDILIPEELPEEIDEEISDEEDENEYLPPAGQLIPGFYTPPNDIAKSNGLAILFPKLVLQCLTPQPEFIPPHVLVMLEINKRYNAIQALRCYKTFIIHMGIFQTTTPFDAVHLAYSVKQYDALNIPVRSDIKLAFMISIEVDLALLELMDLHPAHVSRDSVRGEDECAAIFPVDYADHYPELEDFGCR